MTMIYDEIHCVKLVQKIGNYKPIIGSNVICTICEYF